jgi:predicted phage terminase large subunit-like protein
VKLPALATSDDPLGRLMGEPLWPEWQSKEALDMERARKGPREWSALYQQEPTPEGGLYFEREWLRLERAPAIQHMRIIGASDYAVTEGGGDYTVHVVGGMAPDGVLHILDIYRKQASADQWVEAFVGLLKVWKPVTWGEEDAMILKSVGPFIDRRLSREQLWVHRKGFRPVSDKPTRARTLQAMMAQGKIAIDPDRPWLAGLMSEMLSFPAGKTDDQVDALAILAQLSQDIAPPTLTPQHSAQSYETDYKIF